MLLGANVKIKKLDTNWYNWHINFTSNFPSIFIRRTNTFHLMHSLDSINRKTSIANKTGRFMTTTERCVTFSMSLRKQQAVQRNSQ